MKKLLIYLDNCSYNRPFDDFNTFSTYLEAESKLVIQDLILSNYFDLVWSYILEFENAENPSFEIKQSILKWKDISLIKVKESDKILLKAKELHELGFGIKDSLHLACAIDTKCDFFITTDKGIIKKSKKIKTLKIVNPIEFIEIIEDTNES